MEISSKFKDKILVCIDCKEEFVFTAYAQEYFAGYGVSVDPKYCRACYPSAGRIRLRFDYAPDKFGSNSSGGGNDFGGHGGDDNNDGIPLVWDPRPFNPPPRRDHDRKDFEESDGYKFN